MSELDKIVEQLSKLTVVEASDLAKRLETAWGIDASSVPSHMTTEKQENSTSSQNQEKLEYDVILNSVGDRKINVIKEVKSITGLGLKESKELIESAPRAIKSAIPKDEAQSIQAKLEAAGAKVSLK